MADILEPIKNIEVLRENLAQTSCVSKDAFMKLSDGEAPTLDYNLPQSSTYVTIPNNESIETIKFIGSKKSEYRIIILSKALPCCRTWSWRCPISRIVARATAARWS